MQTAEGLGRITSWHQKSSHLSIWSYVTVGWIHYSIKYQETNLINIISLEYIRINNKSNYLYLKDRILTYTHDYSRTKCHRNILVTIFFFYNDITHEEIFLEFKYWTASALLVMLILLKNIAIVFLTKKEGQFSDLVLNALG